MISVADGSLGDRQGQRYVSPIPESLQRLGSLTFDAWALDGYQKVFWYEAGPSDLALEIGVLLTLTVVFLAAARQVAHRWQEI